MALLAELTGSTARTQLPNWLTCKGLMKSRLKTIGVVVEGSNAD
jgi:hypothetical protein